MWKKSCSSRKTPEIYTAFNLYYEDADSISSLNYLKGKILPFGTEVEISRATKTSISFKDKSTGEETA
jgi:hypothetical protein